LKFRQVLAQAAAAATLVDLWPSGLRFLVDRLQIAFVLCAKLGEPGGIAARFLAHLLVPDAKLLFLLFQRARLLFVLLAAWARAATAAELAVFSHAAVGAVDALDRKPHRLADAIPFVALAGAGIAE